MMILKYKFLTKQRDMNMYYACQLGVLVAVLLCSMFTILQKSILSPGLHSRVRIQNWVCLTLQIHWHALTYWQDVVFNSHA